MKITRLCDSRGTLNGPGIRGLHIEVTLSKKKKLPQKNFQSPYILSDLFSKLKMLKLFHTGRDEMPMAPCNYGFIRQILIHD